MNNRAFGVDPVRVVVDVAARSGAADMALVRDSLARLGEDLPAELNLCEPLPTAAFSRRDRLQPQYDAAVAAAAAYGFMAIVRPVGGHLALYGEGSLVLHHWARHPEPREHIRQRFALVGACIADALRSLGVDALVGSVPGEYCKGEFSVNDAGRTKLAGTGQRIVKAGFLFSAVVMVQSADSARRALIEAYRELGLAFDPATVGCVADTVPGISVGEVREVLLGSLSRVLNLQAPLSQPLGTRLATLDSSRN